MRVSGKRIGHLEEVDNTELRKNRHYIPFSLQQYEGSADAFYDRMEDLINPRPLEPKTLLLALLDAFGEAVARRVRTLSRRHAEQRVYTRRQAVCHLHPRRHFLSLRLLA